MKLVASAVFAMAVLTAAATLFGAGCSQADVEHRGALTAGRTVQSDLDGDGDLERVLFEAAAPLTLTDGDVVYRSRDKWQIVEAHIGDCDRNGLPEVAALLDDANGRHVGLFGYIDGRYGERIVTASLQPPPQTMHVDTSHTDGDVLLVTEEAGPEHGPLIRIYRWNGFGFTIFDPAADQTTTTAAP